MRRVETKTNAGLMPGAPNICQSGRDISIVLRRNRLISRGDLPLSKRVM